MSQEKNEEKLKRKNKSALLMIEALFVMLLWGSLYPTVKLGYQEFGVRGDRISDLWLFAGLRFFLCGAVVCAFCVGKKGNFLSRQKKDWIAVLWVAVFSVALHYSFTYIGLSKTESSKTALLKQLGTLFFVCFSFLFFKGERFTFMKGISALFGVLGIVCLQSDSLKIALGIGEILIILSSFCTVTSNVALKKISPTANPVFVVGFSQILGGAVLLILGFSTGGRLSMPDGSGWLVFGYIAFANIFGYFLWYSIVGKADLSYLFLVKLSEPFFALICSAVILKEDVFKVQYLLSFLCVVVAMVCSNLRFSKKRKE
ncbi:MAG: DMT family transporter [Clostridia bacterium]|nr:DMT family transporter [Clostridia bacterium]